ncbi:hypothetical protein C5167_012259 [Papaver somniferum]|uniref:Uncharacterized protein n=1 Tax=Papaver somniferum TaxID=3469 RepID=A0A4Y7J0X5_PAPSO|nr:hypothetical protein C5167_012259 [Papaver somniferum]
MTRERCTRMEALVHDPEEELLTKPYSQCCLWDCLHVSLEVYQACVSLGSPHLRFPFLPWNQTTQPLEVQHKIAFERAN